MVCGHALTFATARILATFLEIEGHPRRVAVFPDMKTAKAWLTDDTELQPIGLHRSPLPR
jgi:hypothetical protein